MQNHIPLRLHCAVCFTALFYCFLWLRVLSNAPARALTLSGRSILPELLCWLLDVKNSSLFFSFFSAQICVLSQLLYLPLSKTNFL